MIKRWLVIRDDRIVNIILADDEYAATRDLEIDTNGVGSPGIGWTRVNGQWVAPTPDPGE